MAKKKAIRNILEYQEKVGKISRINGKRGHWEVVESDPTVMDLLGDDEEPLNFWLPLGISDYTVIHPGNIIAIIGSTNSAKTLFQLTITRENWLNTHTRKNPIPSFINKRERGVAPKAVYLNSEMSKSEIKKRIRDFGDDPAEWAQHVNFIRRSHSFDKVILPEGLNLIDYLEVRDDFFLAGKYLSDIHDRLESGLAVVAMQKKQDAPFAKGGEMTLEKPRLAINLDRNDQHGFICTIVKLKEPKDFKNNIQGMQRDYVISRNAEIIPISDWRFVSAKERLKINADYAATKLPAMARDLGVDYGDMPENGKMR